MRPDKFRFCGFAKTTGSSFRVAIHRLHVDVVTRYPDASQPDNVASSCNA